MKKSNLAALLAVPLMVFTFALPLRAADATAPTTCKDGTTSTATGRGACSGHGGVQKASKSKPAAAAAEAGSKLTTQDRRFLESLRIQVDQESFDQDADRKVVARLTMTPQDVRFLKSLRIATDDSE